MLGAIDDMGVITNIGDKMSNLPLDPSLSLHVYIYICTYVCICVLMYICMYICTYIFINK
jgi:HrpA-like RNA helicase